MFRISHFMRELIKPTPVGRRHRPSGPVVIWNLIRRCNLNCKHCYSLSTDVDFAGELTTAEVAEVMVDLKRFGVPVLILSGGEPLLRPDIFDISARAKQMGFYVGLSTNGTPITAGNVARIADVGYDYVGISLDGIGEVHDRFRRRDGAFAASLAALHLCRARGIKVGVRFTITQENGAELPRLLDLVDAEEIDKFYLSHLNYAGRGDRNRDGDAAFALTRWAMDQLFERAWDHARNGTSKEFVTGNNDADGVYLLHWVARRMPDRVDHIRAKLCEWGGNSSGVNIANIDNLGNVHPDTFWWHYSLGNVRDRPFSAIWADMSDPIMRGLNVERRTIGGRCATCRHFDICNGNTRVRALKLTGDAWAEDPGCYLTDHEIGIAAPQLQELVDA
ncbi:MAG: heme d1 biosynthesis radical SAM protein NirJ [Alphaproteobacteria bacterium]|nr:heme d1 biosynthesis radical SAM protein NirJ [Alphaproteobacteria bacterium]